MGPKSPQMDGVATSGVALQEVAVCKNSSSVQEQEKCARAGTCKNRGSMRS